MRLIAKCPYCDTCGEVPDHFFGARIRCLGCQNKFVLGSQELVMSLSKCIDDVILESDSIVLFACPRCPVLSFSKKSNIDVTDKSPEW